MQTCATSLRIAGRKPTISVESSARITSMLNVRDECDLPDDDGYDLFTRETEVARLSQDQSPGGTRREATLTANARTSCRHSCPSL